MMNLDNDAQVLMDKLATFKAPPIQSLSPGNARNSPTLNNAVMEITAESAMARAGSLVKPMPQPIGAVTHELIPARGGDVLARVYTPDGEGPFPVLVYFHGGGWVIANLDTYEPSCRALCKKAECIVVSVAYRQAPEHKYPAAAEDAYDALQWVIQNASSLGGDPMRVAVGGESAGGNLATVACLMAIESGGALPVGQLLVYPVTDASMSMPSHREMADVKPLNAKMMTWFWKHYLDNPAQGQEPHASPLNATSLSGLPPAIVITAEFDPLRDEGEAYAQKMMDAGVEVETRRFDGVMHEFFGLAGVVGKATDAVDMAAEGLMRQFAAAGQHAAMAR